MALKFSISIHLLDGLSQSKITLVSTLAELDGSDLHVPYAM
jgi:hypothetical protein